MREIKFRGWISKEYAGEESPVLVTQENNCDCFLISNGSGFSIVDGNHNYIPKEHVVIEQYSGLKDKNGVEIFEGDILSCKSSAKCYQEYGDKYAVYYDSDNAKFECDYQYGLDGYIQNSNIEVIGNIHEVKP